MSKDINQTIAEASLDNLHDIIVPNSVSLFPLASGWYLLFLLLFTLLFYLLVTKYFFYKKMRYQREALREITRYQSKSKEDVLALLALAKRVGIVAYGRERVASLSGEAWWEFMQRHSQAVVSQQSQKEIEALLYDSHASCIDFDAIKGFVTLWIKTHKVVEDV